MSKNFSIVRKVLVLRFLVYWNVFRTPGQVDSLYNLCLILLFLLTLLSISIIHGAPLSFRQFDAPLVNAYANFHLGTIFMIDMFSVNPS